MGEYTWADHLVGGGRSFILTDQPNIHWAMAVPGADLRAEDTAGTRQKQQLPSQSLLSGDRQWTRHMTAVSPSMKTDKRSDGTGHPRELTTRGSTQLRGGTEGTNA